MTTNNLFFFFGRINPIPSLTIVIIVVLSLTSCTYLSIPDPLDIKMKHSSSGKIGILLTQNHSERNVYYRDIPKEIKNAMKNTIKEINKQNDQFVFIDTLGDGDGFDYNQEIIGLEKKNLIELKYSYQQSSVPIIMNVIGALTLGILPIRTNFQFNVSPIVYDETGKPNSLKTIQSPVMSKWNSWLLLPFDSNESKEHEFLQNILTSSIYSAMEDIETTKITINSFQTKIIKLNLPFRIMLADKVRCGNSLLFGYRKNINAASGKSMCKASVLFANKTDGNLTLDSRNFRLKFNDKVQSSLESVSDGKGGMESLVTVTTFNPGPAVGQRPMVIYFAPPTSFGNPSELEYFDKKISELPIFVTLEKNQ
ncbi:hypothetical protein [Leptospira meyeri]|uniref:hypothetical protein n=1 Tax=Leptospira meyeri TaxID=29508 RepID=UPI0002BE1A0E|nr:hypothetical protein [Leptospira meyeri]EMJ88851.1 hypothetical protein LEP1GSC196_2065 [Leptospira meyeri serovar Semaranga str. Veldrot Semarang 173]